MKDNPKISIDVSETFCISPYISIKRWAANHIFGKNALVSVYDFINYKVILPFLGT